MIVGMIVAFMLSCHGASDHESEQNHTWWDGIWPRVYNLEFRK